MSKPRLAAAEFRAALARSPEAAVDRRRPVVLGRPVEVARRKRHPRGPPRH
ncbi:MAG: hypothetical protein M0C28_47930 [Candidatus Moduliflexus flocculans]|nr:hypothetical protein [Candidatus Moduliflexus flocculans]